MTPQSPVNRRATAFGHMMKYDAVTTNEVIQPLMNFVQGHHGVTPSVDVITMPPLANPS